MRSRPFRQLAVVLLLSVACPHGLAAQQPADSPTWTAIRNVVYSQLGDQGLRADVYMPLADGPFPAILMVHGGGWATGSKLQMMRQAQTLVERGYTVVAISYRLAPQARFPAQYEDCLAALRWMHTEAQNYKIDPQRIAGYGYSAGGHLVSLLAVASPAEILEAGPHTTAPKVRLQAVVAGGAPCDFRDVPEHSRVLEYWFGGPRAEKPSLYERASPTAFATADDPPIFFFHGQTDRLVPVSSARGLHEKLKRAGVSTELYVVEGKGHLATFFDPSAADRAADFLDQVLKVETQKGNSVHRPEAAKPRCND